MDTACANVCTDAALLSDMTVMNTFFSISTSVVLGEVDMYGDFICRHLFFQATQSAILMSYVEGVFSEPRLQIRLKFQIEFPNRNF